MKNIEKYFDEMGNVKRGAMDDNPWLLLLTRTDNIYINAERIESVSRISGRETLQYVMRTLDILDGLSSDNGPGLTSEMVDIISDVLKWSEVAKGGLKEEREAWRVKGYPLDIHNIASAEIYRDYMESLGQKCDELVYTLIKTHGLIGQCIRGEIPVSHNRELYEISLKLESDILVSDLYESDLNESDLNESDLSESDIHGFDMNELLVALNECIIRAVSDELWSEVERDVKTLIKRILTGDLSEFSPKYRLEKLCPREIDIFDEDADFFDKKVFPRYELWYFTSALSEFDLGQLRIIFDNIESYLEKLSAENDKPEDKQQEIRHLNFKPLADSLYYDYEGKRHINIYKKRIIEKYLRDSSVQNVDLDIRVENGSAFIDFKFSSVCEKLIDFCVEAERSGLLTFEKSIIVLYDMFGFRRDAFDRLNNEDKYLNTMNDVKTSTKDSIIDYVSGEKIVDVGSGGGILLDRLEERYPDKIIYGTDISSNVIDTLEQKKSKEGHGWSVRVHNFVDTVFDEKVDDVIFSSILHEIYSYTETEKGRFDIQSVKDAIRNAYNSLESGGRIIIRDGIKTDSRELRTVTFKSPSGMEFFNNYFKDFKGLKELSDDEKVTEINEKALSVTGDINFIREFMYTYTWGNESYAHEVQEQFGYFTLAEYIEFMEELGAKIITAREFLEAGYPDNLNNYLTLTDEEGNETEFPNSNCIIVVEKQ